MDVVICNFPPMLPWYLPAAPAILKGACNWLGISSTFIDFNLQEKNLTKWVDQIVNLNPKLVAFSLFSYKSRPYAIELANALKKINPSITILVGGTGVSDALNGNIHDDIQKCLEEKTIDHCVQGDGEYTFPKFLCSFFKLNNLEYFENISPPYYPDYSDYKFDVYQNFIDREKWNTIVVPVTGSKGCVRNCTYCDVPAKWNFVQKNPQIIADEIRKILSLTKDHIHFHFTDSLVNGSLPAFEKMLDLFVEIKQDYPAFNWGGQFIIRRANQSSEEYWKKIALSGACNLEIGVETGSDRLRLEMKKHFTNSDLLHSLKLMEKYQVTCVFLMFTGMPTETDEDFNETLSLLDQLIPYQNTVIKEIELGYLTTINPKTPLLESSLSDSNMILTKNPIVWYNKNNPKLTFMERISRRQRFEDHARSCGYALAWDTHIQIEEAYQSYQDNMPIINLIEKQK